MNYKNIFLFVMELISFYYLPGDVQAGILFYTEYLIKT